MAMSREDLDRFDREINGIYAPPVSYRPQPSPPMADVEGRPITASYSLDDIRRFLGLGGRPAMSPAEVADAAQMYERLPNPALPPTPPGGYDAPSPSIPYMPSTDPRGAAAPIPPPPAPRAARPRPRLPVMQGVPSEADMQFQPARIDTFGGLSPADMAAMAAPAPSPVMDPIGPPPARPIAARGRPSPADLARALRESDERFARSTAQR